MSQLKDITGIQVPETSNPIHWFLTMGTTQNSFFVLITTVLGTEYGNPFSGSVNL